MTSDRLTVLLSSAGRRGALVRALREGGERCGIMVRIVACDVSPLSAAGHLADAFHLVPKLDDPSYLSSLCQLVRRENIDVVVPTIDTELPLLAQHRDEVAAAGAVALVSDPVCIEICGDKERSSRWLSKHGFPVPMQYSPAALAALTPADWPLFFKPRAGSSSIGAHMVAGPGELVLAEERFGPGVVEQFVTGDEYTMDCWVDPAGACINVVPRLRLAVRAGEIAKGVTVARPELQTLCRSVLEAMPGLRGPVTVQVIASEQGQRIIEINPRFGGGYPLSHEAGACYTAVLAAEMTGRPVDPAWLKWQTDLVMLRYDDAVFVTLQDLPQAGQ